jgi:hypothetical protein
LAKLVFLLLQKASLLPLKIILRAGTDFPLGYVRNFCLLHNERTEIPDLDDGARSDINSVSSLTSSCPAGNIISHQYYWLLPLAKRLKNPFKESEFKFAEQVQRACNVQEIGLACSRWRTIIEATTENTATTMKFFP